MHLKRLILKHNIYKATLEEICFDRDPKEYCYLSDFLNYKKTKKIKLIGHNKSYDINIVIIIFTMLFRYIL